MNKFTNLPNIKLVWEDLKNKIDNFSKNIVGKKTSQGGEIFNDYENNKANSNSHAEGQQTKALANGSHAEGQYTVIDATGTASHSEGFRTHVIGLAAHSEGDQTTAWGNRTHSEGTLTIAGSSTGGDSAHAEGRQTVATGASSHSEGSSTKVSPFIVGNENDNTVYNSWINEKFSLAKGDSSHAEGFDCLALGDYSHVEGKNTSTLKPGAHAEGENTYAHGINSHAEGYFTLAKGRNSHAEGTQTNATGNYAHTEGLGTIADNYDQHSQGQYNIKDSAPSPTIYNVAKTAFVIGNGTADSARSDAFKVLFNGQTQADGAYTTPAADYAEYFEWSDGNTNKEDRVGLFVAINGNKIEIAKSASANIIGIVSATPGVIGDNPMLWHGRYLNDKWGRPIYEDVEVKYTEPEVQEDGTIIEVEKPRIDHVRKINPEWKSEETYIPRSERPEWDAVGLLGKLLIRQDGSLKAGDYCTSNDEGIATKSDKGYYVMKVIDDTQALILMK